ncbi:DNA methyltransferase [Alcanivorax sp.]|jgi:adenine-specific DNA-methyltransferase|uniref:DNA methyltransferase n=1 Tax=Alcanivorax sp. TaxID=1872427 RepID=UPI0032D902F0
MSQNPAYDKLTRLLKELFQLDQPDLDFGFYRIMHAKADQVTNFLEEDLLGIVREAFGEADEARTAEAKAEYEAARQQAIEYGAPDPGVTEPVKKAKAAWDAAKESGSNEGDVYDHLYRFFERYYDNGDFMSRRYFARETDGKAAPYAIPYDGREVYLHWANRDQYYIKTSEYLTNFTFDPTQAKEFKEAHGELFEQKPLKIHCRIVSASEGEHNNVKASEQTERYFIIHEPEPVKLEMGDTGEPELVIQFQYRPDPEKTGQDGTWRKKRLAEAAEKVKALLPNLDGADDYETALMTPAPTEAEKDRTLLEKYLVQYTGRNTMDYFIHKDLGGFLRRELDFYIKNEVMRLDDIESADAPRVEAYLAKVKVLRRIAQHLIDFLAQLENFQKKLWLKKKFVVDTQYCITLDRIPADLYADIAKNDAQRAEWVRLYAIDEIEGYSSPLTEKFLQENTNLLVDTAHFSDDISEKLAEFGCDYDGLLIHSENFQALNALREKYKRSIKHVYIDPPYNTNSTPILYKNAYKHSSWASLMQDRLLLSMDFLEDRGVKTIAIDDAEMVNLSKILEDVAPDHRLTKVTVVHNPKGSITKDFNRVHEYSLFLTKRDEKGVIARSLEENETPRKMRRWGENSLRTERRLSFYPIFVKGGEITRVGEVPGDDFHPEGKNVVLDSGEIEIWPVDQNGVERRWNFGLDSIHENLSRVTVLEIDGQLDLFLTHEKTVPKTVWAGGDYDAGNYGNTLLISMLGEKRFDFPKSIKLVERCVSIATEDSTNPVVLDYFGGSGTTAHAVLNLRRKQGKNLKFILAEMGSYFDLVTKPRVLKAAYADSWRDGKPTGRNSGVSVAIKHVRLESYEDVLNNLTFREPEGWATEADFYRDYMLRYWLDFETKGSPSLLNIEEFSDPRGYRLSLKKPGTDEFVEKRVDLIETFNWLIGLHVEHIDRWHGYDAAFKREVDPELPEDTNTRLMLDGTLKEADDGAWRFRKVEGYTLRTPGDHNDREKVLVVWRKLTGDLEQDNLMLDEWFRKYRLAAQDAEFDVIYVNGSNNLPNLRKAEETWKVRLIEEAFHQAMWDVEG